MGSVRRVVLPVAGLGTRFLPATKAMPKEMLPIVDKPLVEHAIDEARAAGIEEFIFVTSRGKTAIEDHFDHHPQLERNLQEKGKINELDAFNRTRIDDGKCTFVRQQNPLGLGHAIWCARQFLRRDEPFAVMLPDDLVLGGNCLGELIETNRQVGGCNVIAVQQVPPEDVSKYGILEVEEQAEGRIKASGFVEKPLPENAPSNYAAIGRYVLEPGVLDTLDLRTRGAGGEIQLTDAIARTLPETPLYGCEFTGTRFDCGSKAGFVKANLAYALSRADMRDEVLRFIGELAEAGWPAFTEEDKEQKAQNQYFGSRDF